MNCIDKIFDEFISIRDEIEISIDKMKNDLGSLAEKIVLYGAGSAGIAFLKYLNDVGLYPKYFSDGKPEKWGTECIGLKVISPDSIVKLLGADALVIVTINTDGKRYCKSFEETLRKGGHSGVHKMLHDYGCKNVIDYTYFRRCHSLFRNDPYNLPSCSDIEIMLKNRDKISFVYDMLEDDLSRETYEKIVRFRLIDDSIEVPTLSQQNQYFEPEFYAIDDEAVFVDCGAFNGISMDTFLRVQNNKFKNYYGFEPDKFNYENLKNYIMSKKLLNEKVHIFNASAYDVNGRDNLYSLSGPGSFMTDIGDSIVDTATIDSVVTDDKVTYIKMNIEGSEIKALKGAENTIKRDKPMLAIAGYHKTWDMWEIPLMIKMYIEDYKINLRSYMNHLSFVFYCR